MPKSISKTEAIRMIKDTDLLEIIFEQIDRGASSTSKQSTLNRFVAEVQKQVKSDRDLKLFAVKVR